MDAGALSAPKSGGRVYQPAIDGLRAVAVALVLWFHARPEQLPGGFLGVSVFFTLSGFLICRLILDEIDSTGTLSLSGFWSRRFRRLVPASCLTLLAVALITALRPFAWGRSPSAAATDVVASFAQVANWWFLWSGRSYSALFAAPSPVQHFWSLAVEEQFYFFFPLLAVAVHRFVGGRRAFIASLCIATVLSWVLMGTAELGDRVYYGTDTRFAEIAVGCLVALATRSRLGRSWLEKVGSALTAFGWIALPVLMGLALACQDRELTAWLYPWGFMATSLLTSVLIVAVATPGITEKLLSLGPLPAIGRASYGIYLFHWPVMRVLTPSRLGLDANLTLVLQLTVTLAAAFASFALIEQPIRHRTRLVGRWAAPAAWGLVAIVLLGWTVAESKRAGMPARWTSASVSELTQRFSEPSLAELGVARQVEELPVHVTSPADGIATPTLFLRGDSVGHYLASAAAAWGRNHKLALRNGAVFSCSIGSVLTVGGDPCPQPADDVLEAARAGVAAVLWFPGVNDVFFEFDGVRGNTPTGRARVVARLRDRAMTFVEAGIPVLINRIADPAPIDAASRYSDVASVHKMNDELDTLDTIAGIVVVPLDHYVNMRTRDRLLRPDGLHTPDPRVGLAFFEAGYGSAVLAAMAEASRELSD
ncbi:MAG: peptidoglycan/LPS O-acetylase OafA/YrhL [Candidatus Binatia bacterium]